MKASATALERQIGELFVSVALLLLLRASQPSCKIITLCNQESERTFAPEEDCWLAASCELRDAPGEEQDQGA